MIKCPKCLRSSPDIRYTGPVLFVDGTAQIDSNGKVVATGPAKATLTVKSGSEFDSKFISFICVFCGYTGRTDEFILVRQCIISDLEADVLWKSPFGTSFWINHDYIQTAERIFSVENAARFVNWGDV